jgi:hypothetical protein
MSSGNLWRLWPQRVADALVGRAWWCRGDPCCWHHTGAALAIEADDRCAGGCEVAEDRRTAAHPDAVAEPQAFKLEWKSGLPQDLVSVRGRQANQGSGGRWPALSFG